jgi:transcription elongation factor GreB
MSKAFTREPDGDEDELDLDGADAPKTPFRNYITPWGHRRLVDELRRLWDVERPPLVETITWAASNGDRSENGDYIYGKRRLREIDRRVRFLRKRLETAEVVDNSGKAHACVYFGATVTFVDEDDKESTVSIVGVDEIMPERNRVSWISPVAKALMNARVGDVVTMRTPGGPVEIEVLAIRYQALD